MSLLNADRDRLRRRGVWLEGTSLAWTVTLAAVALTAGVITTSIALIGLGLDSAIEMLAAGIVIWQLSHAGAGRETRAAGLIAIIFLAGAAFLLAESIRELAVHTRAEPSVADVALAAAALVVLPVLALAKLRAGRALDSHPLIADAAETGLTAAAAAAALAGAGLDTWLGWWWAVPAAGIAIAILAIIEAAHTWRRARRTAGPVGDGGGPAGAGKLRRRPGGYQTGSGAGATIIGHGDGGGKPR